MSDYNTLIANTIPSKWAKEHLPVLSRRGHDPARYTTFTWKEPPRPIPTPIPCQDDHILFTQFSNGQPKGRLIKCHNRCEQSITTKQTAAAVRITCNACKSKCTVKQFKTDMITVLGRHALVAVRYPQDLYPVQWELPKEPSSAGLAPPDVVVRSASLPGSTCTTPTVTPQQSPPPSPPPLRIRIHPMASSPNLSLAGSSGSGEGGMHSVSPAPTPPPPAPQKRFSSGLGGRTVQKRQRHQEDQR